ncbi:MAG TPA: nitrate reductase [Victivallales bacterium]|nr:nitrate reductase [Victivallales bacterium]
MNYSEIKNIIKKSGRKAIINTDDVCYYAKDAEPEKWEHAICRYCGTGCGMMLGIKDEKIIAVKGNKDYPVNKGLLCLKGLTVLDVLYSDERAVTPLIRENDNFNPCSFDTAYSAVADKIQEVTEKYGSDAVALYVGAQMFTEEMYLANKLFKGLLKTNNVDANARLCMASAVTGYVTSFGIDEPLGNYNDIENSDAIFMFGANPAENHPVIFGRILEHCSKNKNVKLIVIDPRFTATASHADIWLPLYHGSDMLLFNSIQYVLFAEGYTDENFIREHTNIVEGGGPWGEEKHVTIEDYIKFLSDYKPEKVADEIGIQPYKIYETARLFGKSENVLSLWTMGINQHKYGTWMNNSISNLHLLTGKICRPGSTPLSMTGQPNACGGTREQGMMCNALPGHRTVSNSSHREEIEKIWKIPDGSISPKPGPHTMKMFDELGSGKIKLIWIACTNPAQTLPNLKKYLPKLKDAFVIVQDIFPPTQYQIGKCPNLTAEYADVFLPSAFWIEKGGVFGNTERRSSLSRKIIPSLKNLPSDGEIFIEVAKKLGFSKFFESYNKTEEIWNEYLSCTKGTDMDLSGASYKYLSDKQSAQWPILKGGSVGSEIRCNIKYDKYLKKLVDDGNLNIPDDGIYFYGFPDGRAKIFQMPHLSAGEVPDKEFPFYLTTGRIVHHWHSGTMTMRSKILKSLVKSSFIEINIEDAERLNISNNDKVKITSRRGELNLTAKIVNPDDYKAVDIKGNISITRPGVLFIPFFDPHSLTNILTADHVDELSKEPEYKVCAVKILKV